MSAIIASSRTVNSMRPLAREIVKPFLELWHAAWIYSAIILLALFPYVQIYLNDHDVQPHVSLCLTLAGCVLLLRGERLLNALAIPLFAAPAVGLILGNPVNEIVRATGTYCTVFFAYGVATHAIRQGFPIISLLKVVLIVSFCIALWQFGVSATAFDSIAPVRSSADRGVTALAVEPSFYGLGVVIMTMIVVVYALRWQEKAIFAIVGIVQVIVFSQSSLAILLALAITGMYALTFHRKIKRAAPLLALAFAAVALAFWSLMPEDSRAYRVVIGLATDPLSVFYRDISIALRASHVVLPIAGAISNWFVPQGFFAFQVQVVNADWWPLFVQPTHRIMSGYGAAFFELGIFSLPILYYNLRPLLLRGTGLQLIERAVLCAGILLGFLNAISLALPLFGIAMATLNNSSRSEVKDA